MYENNKVGIELEYEGNLGPLPDTYSWNSVADGSLVNGVEYVLVEPTSLIHLTDKLDELFANLAGKVIKKSVRTSTHIHVDVRNLTFQQRIKALIGFWAFENALVETQPQDRRGNHFCLRYQDCSGLYENILQCINVGDFFHNPREYKYAAANIASIPLRGSLEFRFLEAMTDKYKIFWWARLLTDIVNTCANLDTKELHDLIETGEILTMFDTGVDINDLRKSLETNKDDLLDFCGELMDGVPEKIKFSPYIEKKPELDNEEHEAVDMIQEDI